MSLQLMAISLRLRAILQEKAEGIKKRFSISWKIVFFDILRNNSDGIKGRKSILFVVSHRGIYFPLQIPWSHTAGKQSLRLFGSRSNVSPSDLSVFYKDCYSRNPSLENLSGFLPFRSEALRFRE